MKYGIIAAGEGSRLIKDGFLGFKPMVIVGSETLLQRLVRIFSKNNASEIFIIVNQKEKELVDYINKIGSSTFIKVIVKNTESSAHSFFEIVKEQMDIDEICVSTIDAIFDEREFSDYIKTFTNNSEIDGLMALTTFIEDDTPLYVELTENNIVTGFSDLPIKTNKTSTISGGIYCLRNKAIRLSATVLQNRVSRMRNYQQELINNGLKIKGYIFSKIIDIDHLSDIEKAGKFLSSQS